MACVHSEAKTPAVGAGGEGERVRAGSRVVALAVVAVVVAACSSGSTAHVHASRSAYLRGGTLQIALGVRPSEFKDPVQRKFRQDYAFDPQGYSRPGCVPDCAVQELFRCCLLRTLYSYEGMPAEAGGSVLRPDLADGFPTVSSDGLIWTIHIKPGIHYAPPLDHTVVTAQDFVRAIDRELSPPTPFLQRKWGATVLGDHAYDFQDIIQGASDFATGKATTISGLQATNPTTLVIDLTRPTGDLAARFSLPDAAPIPPLPGDPTAQLGVAEGHSGNYERFLVATGPYMIEGSDRLDFTRPPGEQVPASGFDPETHLTLIRNPSWERATDPLRPAYVDRIKVTFGSEEIGQVVPVEKPGIAAQVDSGRLDFVFDANAPHDQVLRYQSTSELKGLVHQNPTNAVFPVSMNLSLPPLDDIHVRKAIDYAVDRRGMQAIIEGAGVPGDVAGHLVANSLEGGILEGYDPYRTPNDGGSLARAKAEMRQSRYDSNHDGICDVDCGPLSFPVPDFVPLPVRGEACSKGALIEKNLAKIGLDIVPWGLSVAEDGGGNCVLSKRDEALANPPFAFQFGQPPADYQNGSTYMTVFLSDDWLQFQNGVTPEQRQKDPALVGAEQRKDACLQLIGQLQTRCWAELDQFLMEYVVPAFPWLYPTNVVVTSARVRHFEFDQSTSLPALDQISLAGGGG
jgi:ABC-type transport system substrate-binding protein